MRFGTDATWAPFESKVADGKLVGFDIDPGNEICARLKAKCVWSANDFDAFWAPKGANVVSCQNQDQLYSDLLSGRLDATLQDEVQADRGFLKTPRGAGHSICSPASRHRRGCAGVVVAVAHELC